MNALWFWQNNDDAFECLYGALKAAQRVWDKADGGEWVDDDPREAEWHRLMDKVDELVERGGFDLDPYAFTTRMTRNGLRKLMWAQ